MALHKPDFKESNSLLTGSNFSYKSSHNKVQARRDRQFSIKPFVSFDFDTAISFYL